jgi:hypothetical protein
VVSALPKTENRKTSDRQGFKPIFVTLNLTCMPLEEGARKLFAREREVFFFKGLSNWL